ncbi:ABC transporter substrate-binding protein [Hyalangium minutum]|uniref:Branched-chain amino acid ABC transporter, amino acid-binding protein n=1 Tax=Hyalangium minutum TaxID=394096 RepID=A0A085WS04_9BACT|nr:ABC transporter substrate-binding protein [Hyalangium minutum]KFE70467.1 Branched-chain amino acid ABC transporter, amino acid-binding protein [Hyalangium minutum]
MHRFAPMLALLVVGASACERKASPPPDSAALPGAPQAATPPQPRPPDADEGAIVIGSIGSLTGSSASFGGPVRDGIQFAVEEINAAGGVKGRHVVLRAYDSQGRLEESVSAAKRLITKDQVSLILGDVSSSNSMAVADLAQAAHVPMVTPSSTHPDVTRKGDYIFRTCFIDSFQGQVMARFAREHLKLERIAILQDGKNAYSLGLGEAFSQAFSQLGGKIAAVESYAQGDTDFRAPLLAVKKVKPQALYIPGFYGEVGLIARQAREVGLTQPLLGGDGWDSERLLELAGNAMEGSYYSSHSAVDNPSPELQRFAAAYQKRYGRAPDVSAVLGYDAARVALAALEQAEGLSGPAIRDALARTKDFPSVSGNITLDAARNAIKPAVILKIQGGRRQFTAVVTP